MSGSFELVSVLFGSVKADSLEHLATAEGCVCIKG